MNEKLQKEVAQTLKNIEASQGYALGQIQALEVALGACFVTLRDQPEVLEVVRSALSSRSELVRQQEKVLSVRDGYDSMTRSLLAYMGEHQPESVHTLSPGGLN